MAKKRSWDGLLDLDDCRRDRTPQELLDWTETKIEELGKTPDGKYALRLRRGLPKRLVEEIYPLALLATSLFGNRTDVVCRPSMGYENFDAEIIDSGTSPPTVIRIEVTVTDYDEDMSWRMEYLQKHGFVPFGGPVHRPQKGEPRSSVKVDWGEADDVKDVVNRRLQGIKQAVMRKSSKKYDPGTSLLVWFNAFPWFQKEPFQMQLLEFVRSAVLPLATPFSDLYLVGGTDTVLAFSRSEIDAALM